MCIRDRSFFVCAYHSFVRLGSVFHPKKILLNVLLPSLLASHISSNKDPRSIVDNPISLPPVGRLMVGYAAVHMSLAHCWKAHSSNITKFAVKERPLSLSLIHI